MKYCTYEMENNMPSMSAVKDQSLLLYAHLAIHFSLSSSYIGISSSAIRD